MFMYVIFVFGSIRPELGWNKQYASVSGLGSSRYAKYGYGLIMNGPPFSDRNCSIGFMNGDRSEWNAPDDGGSDADMTAMEWTVETLMPELGGTAAWRFCMAGRSCG